MKCVFFPLSSAALIMLKISYFSPELDSFSLIVDSSKNLFSSFLCGTLILFTHYMGIMFIKPCFPLSAFTLLGDN